MYDRGKIYKFVEAYSDTFIKRSEVSTNEEITTNRPSTGQNIALELDVTVEISLLGPIWTAQRSLAAVSLSSEQKLKDRKFWKSGLVLHLQESGRKR